MDCKKNQKYIVLKSEGLSPTEQKELEQHIQTCASCRKLSALFENSKMVIGNIREKEPELINPGLLTNQIMQSVKKLEIKKQSLVVSILNQFLDWFFLPFVRPALVSLAVFMISWFIYHESADQLEIVGLENRLRKYSVEEYVAVQESHRQFFSISTIQRHNGMFKYFLSKYPSELSSYNQINRNDKLVKAKSGLILLKHLNQVKQ